MTGFSGNGPSERSLVKSYDLNQALYGATWGEDTDDPCFLEAKYRNIATGELGAVRTFDECDGHNAGNFKYILLPEDYFVTGVRVCLNEDRDKVKGIQLIGQHILCLLGAEGAWTSDDGTSYYQGGGMEYVLHSDPERRFVPVLGTRTRLGLRRRVGGTRELRRRPRWPGLRLGDRRAVR